jgi:eukaryotic-like serine/threonine-protein kinase
VDFGIAALAGERRLTASGEIVGTLAYMAPEQAEGGDAGPQADLYSLALTLYECWSGSNPVAAATPAATARRIGSPLTPLGEARRDLPQDLTEAIEACLAPDPGARPPTAELVATLERELGALDAGSLLPPTAEDATATFAGPGRRGRMLAALALAGILWAVAAAAGRPGLALVLAAAALFAVGALAFGWIARAHLALAAFGALFWAAALTGALRVIGEPGPIASPLVAVAAAIVTLVLARHPRSRRRRGLEPRSVPAGASPR